MNSYYDLTTSSNHGGNDNGLSPHAKTVLVAEDSSLLRELVTCQLRALGYEVLNAADGLEAQELMRASRDQTIDLLLTDCEMPRMRGEELANWFCAERPRSKVLFMSTVRGACPADKPFLQKPFTLASLQEKIREALNHSKP